MLVYQTDDNTLTYFDAAAYVCLYACVRVCVHAQDVRAYLYVCVCVHVHVYACIYMRQAIH